MLIMVKKCGSAASQGLQPVHQLPTGRVAQDGLKSSADASKADEMVREIDKLVSESEFLPEAGINAEGLLCVSRWEAGRVVWSAVVSGETLTGERVPLPERREPAVEGRPRSPAAYAPRRSAPSQLRKALQQEFVETEVSRRLLSGAEGRLPALRDARSKSGSRAGSLSSISTVSDDSWMDCLRSSYTSGDGSHETETRGRSLRRDGNRKKVKDSASSVIQQVHHKPTPPASPPAQPRTPSAQSRKQPERHTISISPLNPVSGDNSLERVMDGSKHMWIMDGPGFPEDKYHRADISLDGSRSLLARDDEVYLDTRIMRSTSVASRVARLERQSTSTTSIAHARAKSHENHPDDPKSSKSQQNLPDVSHGSNKLIQYNIVLY